MSENSQSPSSSTPTGTLPKASAPNGPLRPGQDWFLETVVRLVNDDALPGFGITLSVGGVLITGTLASGRAYFEGIGEEFSSGIRERDIAGKMRDFFAGFARIYAPSDKPGRKKSVSYIHLKDARIMTGTAALIPSNRGVWWRSRLTAVDGFCLGVMASEG